ncbi:MAG: (d)CMP kinase [Pirellulaceae bacterium]
MIVTIDGPAGAGKSSASKLLARELGFRFLDTGAMYRAVTWAVMNEGLDLTNTTAVAKLARRIRIEMDIESDTVMVDGEDVTQQIRDPAVTKNVAPVADNPLVREILVELQRKIAQRGNFVCEGRDQGTVAFPDAECKIFLTASAEHRARRRLLELEAKNIPADYSWILHEQNIRDRGDQERPVGRLRKAEDAIEVFTDDLSLREVVAKLKEIVQSKMNPTS